MGWRFARTLAKVYTNPRNSSFFFIHLVICSLGIHNLHWAFEHTYNDQILMENKMNGLLMLKSELSIPIPNPISNQMLGSSRCKVLNQVNAYEPNPSQRTCGPKSKPPKVCKSLSHLNCVTIKAYCLV